MRKFLFLNLFSLLSLTSYALHVEKYGDIKTTLLYNDGDTIFVFDGEPALRSKIGATKWYHLPDTISPIQSGTDYLYAEHGEGYAIKVDGQWEYFWCFDYDSLRAQIDDIQATLSCHETELQLIGTIPQLQYTNLRGQQITYPRLCRVTYMDAQWSNEDERWVDSLAIAEKEFTNNILLEPSPVTTNFIIADILADLLEITTDSLYSDFYDPVAIKAHPLAIVTTRGKVGERTNEVERPVDPTTLLRRSAPLIVTFKANALNADYYGWHIRRGADEILHRAVAQHEYTFTEPGNYVAIVGMGNEHGCTIDSVSFDIAVSESMLRVPNVFTPNGDGTHDEFRVVYRSIKEYQIHIYNRWGHLVYKSNDPAKGWDGTINGRPAAEGAYYYVIRAMGTDADLNAKYMMKPVYNKRLKKQELPLGVYQLSGDINLLR